MTNEQRRRKVTESVRSLIDSCVEGYTQEWDCSMGEGREGFVAMYEALVEIAQLLGINIRGCKRV